MVGDLVHFEEDFLEDEVFGGGEEGDWDADAEGDFLEALLDGGGDWLAFEDSLVEGFSGSFGLYKGVVVVWGY